jgi:hypothetical protein
MLKSKLLICLSVFFLFSCSSNSNRYLVDPVEHPELADQSWFSGNPCSAPCWHGLEIGQSTKQESIDIVKGLTFVDGKNYGTHRNSVNFPCKAYPEMTCVFMIFEEDILVHLSLFINYRVTIEEIVKKFGPPDPDIAFYNTRNPEGPGCDISLFWKKQQRRLDIYDQNHTCWSLFKQDGKFPNNLYAFVIRYTTLAEMKNDIENLQHNYQSIQWNGFSE